MHRSNTDCRTLEELRAYTDEYYRRGGNECYDSTAPWCVPEDAEILEEHPNGDITIEFSSGERARWDNDRREWVEAE